MMDEKSAFAKLVGTTRENPEAASSETAPDTRTGRKPFVALSRARVRAVADLAPGGSHAFSLAFDRARVRSRRGATFALPAASVVGRAPARIRVVARRRLPERVRVVARARRALARLPR
jgi:hypothetical protein